MQLARAEESEGGREKLVYGQMKNEGLALQWRLEDEGFDWGGRPACLNNGNHKSNGDSYLVNLTYRPNTVLSTFLIY